MTIKAGDRLPEATFKVRTANGMDDVTTAGLTAGKKVVLFAVPGAFTPSCNDRHLPSYVRNVEALKAKGVDTIACVAVNDAFVLDAWARSVGTGDGILMLADGNGTFTKAVGLDFDGSAHGLGLRSRRYAMIVEDGVVEHLAVEDAPPMVEASRAERLLEVL
ncbi:MAG: peroxiredoxin [Geminicoccaceae bacterium]|nr:peroxiredoxin [Geminicoccaceae bacterium]